MEENIQGKQTPDHQPPSIEDLTKEELKVLRKAEKEAAKKERKKQEKAFQKWLVEQEAAAQAEAERPRNLYETKKEPRKALATFFRNQNKVLVSSMAIADRKAMIMIRINSLIVTIAMIFFRVINEQMPMGWLVGLILIVGAGVALVFAVLAARPNGRFMLKIGENEIKPKYPAVEARNFWVPHDVNLDEYEQSMDKVVNSQELQIGNQVRFTYMVEKYLGTKYHLLDIAYNVFLVSMVLAGLTFLLVRLGYYI